MGGQEEEEPRVAASKSGCCMVQNLHVCTLVVHVRVHQAWFLAACCAGALTGASPSPSQHHVLGGLQAGEAG